MGKKEKNSAIHYLPSHSGAFVIHRDLQLMKDIHGHEPVTSLSQVRGLGYPLSTWHLPRCHLPTEVLRRCHCHHVPNATEWQHLAVTFT